MKAILAVIVAIAVRAQTPPSFDVASVRQSDPAEQGGRIYYLPGGAFSAPACGLTYLIERLYGVRAFQLLNLPKWVSETGVRFTIQARAAESVSNDQLRLMAQNLLVDRFGFRFHREARDVDVYALVVGKNGPKLQVAKNDGNPRGSGGVEAAAPGWYRGTNVSLTLFAEALSAPSLGRPIVDKTGFSDPIDFDLRFAPDQSVDDPHPSLLTAIQEQLGLKLEPQRLSMDVLVIDNLDRPSAN